jgi:transcriptional regulator with XRE-family HTH domain
MGSAPLRVSGRNSRDHRLAIVAPRSLHRLGVVRRLQGISRRALAQRLGCDTARIKHLEQSTTDLPLSELYRWQQALEVPLMELLVEADDRLAPPILRRAQLVRIMKTALAIQESTTEDTVRRMAELRQVSAWHSIGRQRTRKDYGVAADRRLSPDVFIDLVD